MKNRRRLIGVLAAVVLALTGAFAFAMPAQAASPVASAHAGFLTSCPPSCGYGKQYLYTWGSAPGYQIPETPPITGYLYSGYNYVYCRVWGAEVSDPTGQYYNHWWLRTDLDSGNPWQDQWVSAYYISNEGNDQAYDINHVDIQDC